MNSSPALQGLLRGKLPSQRKANLFFVEVSLNELRIYNGSKEATQPARMHIRSLIINHTDRIEEQRSKWFQKQKFKFYIDRVDGKYVFQCESREECSRWVSCLQQQKGNQHEEEKRSPTPPIPPQASVLFSGSSEERPGYQESDWESLVQAKWFWGYMNRGDSEKKLYNEGKIGDFIVRLNSDRQLVISLWRCDGIQHHIIVCRGDFFQFQKGSCESRGETLIDLLEAFMVENNGSIHPIGDSMYTLDMDYSWKKKSLVLNVTSRANSYNLVQLKPSSGKKQFHIKEEPPKPKDSALFNTSTNGTSKIRDHSTEEKSELTDYTTSSLNSKAGPQQALLPCMLPPQDFCMEVLNPEYVNIGQKELQSVIKHEVNECKSDFESDEYENPDVLEQLQESATVPTYINLKQ